MVDTESAGQLDRQEKDASGLDLSLCGCVGLSCARLRVPDTSPHQGDCARVRRDGAVQLRGATNQESFQGW